MDPLATTMSSFEGWCQPPISNSLVGVMVCGEDFNHRHTVLLCVVGNFLVLTEDCLIDFTEAGPLCSGTADFGAQAEHRVNMGDVLKWIVRFQTGFFVFVDEALEFKFGVVCDD